LSRVERRCNTLSKRPHSFSLLHIDPLLVPEGLQAQLRLPVSSTPWACWQRKHRSARGKDASQRRVPRHESSDDAEPATDRNECSVSTSTSQPSNGQGEESQE